jgi:hypothetical protein
MPILRCQPVKHWHVETATLSFSSHVARLPQECLNVSLAGQRYNVTTFRLWTTTCHYFARCRASFLRSKQWTKTSFASFDLALVTHKATRATRAMQRDGKKSRSRCQSFHRNLRKSVFVCLRMHIICGVQLFAYKWAASWCNV